MNPWVYKNNLTHWVVEEKAQFKHQNIKRSRPHRNSTGTQTGLGLLNGVLTIMKNTGCQHRIGATELNAVGQILE